MPRDDQRRPASREHAFVHPKLARLRRNLGADDELPIDPDLEPEDTRAPSAGHLPHTAPPPFARSARVLAAVFFGGALGTAARDAVLGAWPQPGGHFPVTVFVINTSGAFLLGVVLAVLLERLPRSNHAWRTFLGAGVLGGWTTYSSLAAGADALVKGGHLVTAAGYVTISLLCGIVAAALGIALGRSRVAIAGARAIAPTGGGSASEGAASDDDASGEDGEPTDEASATRMEASATRMEASAPRREGGR